MISEPMPKFYDLIAYAQGILSDCVSRHRTKLYAFYELYNVRSMVVELDEQCNFIFGISYSGEDIAHELPTEGLRFMEKELGCHLEFLQIEDRYARYKLCCHHTSEDYNEWYPISREWVGGHWFQE